MRQSSTRVPASAWTLGILSLAPFYITSAIYCYGPPRLNDVADSTTIATSRAESPVGAALVRMCIGIPIS
jgi:hypothetical protein